MPSPHDDAPEVERAQAQIFDWEAMRDYFGYVKNALLRHTRLGLGPFVVTAALGLALAKFLPRTFYSEATLLPKRASTIAALVNPDRIPAMDADPPNPLRPPGEIDSVTRSAAQAVMRRENLVSLIKRVNLLDRWDSTRAPLLRFKDQVMHLVSGRPSEDIKLDAMVGMLEKSLTVSTEDGRVAISVMWPEPQLAYELVEAAQQGFLEARQREDLASITDAQTILEEHEKSALESYTKAFVSFEKIFAAIMIERRRAVGDPRVGGFNTNQQMAEMRFLIRAKRRAIDDSESLYNRRLEGLRAEMVSQRKLVGENHPSLVSLEQQVAALQAEGSLNTSSLRSEEKQMTRDYERIGGGSVPFPDEPVPDPYGPGRGVGGRVDGHPARGVGEPQGGDGAGRGAHPQRQPAAAAPAHRDGQTRDRHRQGDLQVPLHAAHPGGVPPGPHEAQREGDRHWRHPRRADPGGLRGARARRAQWPALAILAGQARPGPARAGRDGNAAAGAPVPISAAAP